MDNVACNHNSHVMVGRGFPYKHGPMDVDAKDRLARINDSSNAAAGFRLAAAINAAGLSPTDFARRSGQHPNAIFNTIAGRSFPSVKTMKALWRVHRIDPAFVMFGDYGQLPVDVQDRIFDAMQASAADRRADSG